MKRLLIGMTLITAVFGSMVSVYATDARVLTMGRSDMFFMDDISIYRNPANIGIYPNMLIGSMGEYRVDSTLEDTGTWAGLANENRDPQKPFFGGILSKSLENSPEGGKTYPALSVGVVLNRYDEMLGYIDPNNDKFVNMDTSLINYEKSSGRDAANYGDPKAKVDLMMEYTTKNGAMIGIGGYLAGQRVEKNGETTSKLGLYKGNIGVNVPVAKTMDFEAYANGGIITCKGEVLDTTSDKDMNTVADNDVFVQGGIRLFSAMSNLNGDFVPALEGKYIKHNSNDESIGEVNGGVGININIDRGFFWGGVNGYFRKYSNAVINNDLSSLDVLGGRISFGIERNIIWDWFVWRVGATKTLYKEQIGSQEYSSWNENPEATGEDDDHVAFGIGLNIENRLKVDAVMSEDIFYTFTNLLSGSMHHITTRITATYSF